MDALNLLAACVLGAVAAASPSICKAQSPASADTLPLPESVGSLAAHLRVSFPREGGSASLHWHRGSLHMQSIPGTFDDISGASVRVTAMRADSVMLRHDLYGNIDPSRGISMRIRFVAGEKAVAEFGTTMAAGELEIDFPSDPGYLVPALGKGVELLRFDVEADTLPRPTFAPFTSVEELVEKIARTSDPYEGLWTYLDRSNNPLLCVPGGTYSLATLATGGGAYALVYLDGAEANAHLWQPLRIKGWLIPTIFPGHYDLKWVSADGNHISYETSATLSGGSLMELNFPAWQTTIRFRRQPLPPTLTSGQP